MDLLDFPSTFYLEAVENWAFCRAHSFKTDSVLFMFLYESPACNALRLHFLIWLSVHTGMFNISFLTLHVLLMEYTNSYHPLPPYRAKNLCINNLLNTFFSLTSSREWIQKIETTVVRLHKIFLHNLRVAKEEDLNLPSVMMVKTPTTPWSNKASKTSKGVIVETHWLQMEGKISHNWNPLPHK